ncbi:MAG: LamG-like jellyroll fold domain-containing protein [Kiritimatiellia bacterium]
MAGMVKACRDAGRGVFSGMVRTGVALSAAFVCGVGMRALHADVVTNVWVTPDGGNWLDADADGKPLNWDAATTNDVVGTVADFPLNPQARVNTSPGGLPVAGMIFHSADGSVADPESWPSWYIGGEGIVLWPSLLGYFPLRVSDGCLAIESGISLEKHDGIETLGPVRKEGNGSLRVGSFLLPGDANQVFEIEAGKVFPTYSSAFAHMDVRVASPAAELALTNCSFTRIGALTPWPGVPMPLMGNELWMGQLTPAILPGEVCGTGRVTAVDRVLTVTNVQPNFVYGARGGILRLDATASVAPPFASYDFETSLVADGSGNGRNLVQWGTVERVWDETRASYVARFSSTGDSGGQLVATVPGVQELTGDADYTVSFWAKASLPCASAGPTFFSLGTRVAAQSTFQFRFTDNACTNLLLGHWCSEADFSGIRPTVDPASWDPASWHHYVAMREGCFYSVWLDGRCILFRDGGKKMTLDSPAQITLGALVGWSGRNFNGDMDDVRIYSCAVGAAGVASLFAGREPAAADTASTAGEVLPIPEGTKLSLGLNGEIQLAGNPSLAATNITVTSSRGTLSMPAGGSLTLTGPGSFTADVTGANAFVKEGPERLVLSGSLRHTGGTEVRQGTLALQYPAVLPPHFAFYDFELSLGADSSVNGGKDLTAQVGVTRVYDAERGGYVASFSGTENQQLDCEVSSQVLTGNADYTLSVWAKPDADCPAAGTFLSLGEQSNFKEIVFRYKDISSGSLVLSHWGGILDFVDIPGPASPQGAWHHYVAVKRGATFTVFCDGEQVWQTENEQPLDLNAKKKVYLGHQIENSTRQFKGLLDDVRIYACALDADQLAALNRRGEPSVSGDVLDVAKIPAPILHYAFENPDQPGFDSAPGAHHLAAGGSGTFGQIDSPLGGKALQFDAYAESYLMSEELYPVLPQAGMPFTVSIWVLTAKTDIMQGLPTQPWNKHAPTFISWGDPVARSIYYMLSYHYDPSYGMSTLRQYARKDNGNGVDQCFWDYLTGLRSGEERLRWHHYATTYDPAVGLRTYIDGEAIGGASSAAFTTPALESGCIFYLGMKSTAYDASAAKYAIYFTGALDEVKVYDAALDLQQIRTVMRADAGKLRILPEGGAVTIAADAALVVSGTQETFGPLAGDGTLNLSGGCVTLTNGTSTFTGPVIGSGVLRLPSGTSLALAQRPDDFNGVFEMAGGTLDLPDASTPVPAMFRTVVIDGTRRVSYPGAVEIPDGTAIALSQTETGPLVSADGPVTICGGGTVTLPDPKARGTWILAHGTSLVDQGTTDLSARWTVSNFEGSCTPAFVLTRTGDFICRVLSGGTMLIVR